MTKWIFVCVLAATLHPASAFAVDGVIEINQVAALAGGVTAGDAAGFPVTISAGGSYRLTSNLQVPVGLDGISVLADDVTIDLNGFAVKADGRDGPANGIRTNSRNTEIKNGTVRDFETDGIHGTISGAELRVIDVRVLSNQHYGINILSGSSLISGCTATGNGPGGGGTGGGVFIEQTSLVLNSNLSNNAGVGLTGGVQVGEFQSGYRSNHIGNNGTPSTTGSLIDLGANIVQ